MVHEEVGADEVAEVVAAWTGIPTGRLLKGETGKLLRIEDEIGRRLIGQRAAVKVVSDAVRHARAGSPIPAGRRVVFVPRPTGVGRPARQGARGLPVRRRARDHPHRHERVLRGGLVSRLVGAPPGYVGYDEGGQLTEAVRRRPYSVVLLDEVEKAHPEVFDILLQVLDDGRPPTDRAGPSTSATRAGPDQHLGSQYLVDPLLDEAKKRDAVMAAVRANFKPEFLNRLDEVVLFDPLGTESSAASSVCRSNSSRPGWPRGGSHSTSRTPLESGSR